MLLITIQSKYKPSWRVRYKTHDGAFWPIPFSMHFLQVRANLHAFCLRLELGAILLYKNTFCEI